VQRSQNRRRRTYAQRGYEKQVQRFQVRPLQRVEGLKHLQKPLNNSSLIPVSRPCAHAEDARSCAPVTWSGAACGSAPPMTARQGFLNESAQRVRETTHWHGPHEEECDLRHLREKMSSTCKRGRDIKLQYVLPLRRTNLTN
jgi:hypothetical protein